MSNKFLSTLKKSAQVAGDVLTTKGDILSRSASALGRLAVESNGKVLTCKSSETLGISWETPSTGATLESNTFTGLQTTQDGINNTGGNITNSGFYSTGGAEALTLSSGVVTANRSYIQLSTEGGASTDDCTAIGVDNTGDIIIIRSERSDQDPTLIDGTPLRIAGDFTFASNNDKFMAIEHSADRLTEISRSTN